MRYIGGSIQNRLYETSKMPTPEVGMGATMISWSDRSPYTIVEIVNDKTIVVQADDYKRIDHNGLSESQRYEFTPNAESCKDVVTKRKNGSWVRQGESMKNGTAFVIGERMCYRDPHF